MITIKNVPKKVNWNSSILTPNLEMIGPSPSSRFLNRELSWLAFNTRVLEEAQNTNVPLLERVKFLSISASNLDEFYMVRVAGLKDQLKNNRSSLSNDGLTPLQQLDAIREKVDTLTDQQETCWSELQSELEQHNIRIVKKEELSSQDKALLKAYFAENIFPVLSPIAIDPAHPFPFIPNGGMAVVVSLKKTARSSKTHKAIIPLPGKVERLVRIEKGREHFVLLEDAISLFQKMLFPNRIVTSFGLLRVLRDSDLEIEEEAEDLLTHFEMAVKRRRRGDVILLKCCGNISEDVETFVKEQLFIESEDIIKRDNFIGYTSLIELYGCDKPALKFPVYEERSPERINDFKGDCFAAIEAKDIVVHHPFETFDVVVNFLEQAAQDPNVVAIKQTLYRTSSDSPIVKALIKAAEAGKSVTVVVELKARFDEEANMRWARDLERVGAQVIFGIVELKTHAKISLVARREHDKLISYVHFGTGNYHPVTAKIYTDLSFFTCNKALCEDANYIFNFLTGYTQPKKYHALIVSPTHLRANLLKYIMKEVEYAKAGKPATIWAKMNALVDPIIIDALYTASQAGVQIELIVRGICCLRPQVKGLSDNIHVKSIVGRFLEHPRIACFGNGHPMPSEHGKVFISSADWMPRNFDHRVEVMVPITNPTVHEQILEQIMVANLKDQRQSWQMLSDGNYQRVSMSPETFSAHEYFMHNPSLSGRGKALTPDATIQQRNKIHSVSSLNKD